MQIRNEQASRLLLTLYIRESCRRLDHKIVESALSNNNLQPALKKQLAKDIG